MHKRNMALKFCYSVVFLATIGSCSQSSKNEHLFTGYKNAFESGEFARMSLMHADLRNRFSGSDLQWKVDSLMEIALRTELEFPLSEAEIQAQLNSLSIDYSTEDLIRWQELNWLEYRFINNEKRYFKRAATNLCLILEHHRLRSEFPSCTSAGEEKEARLGDVRKILAVSTGKGELTNPVHFRLDYSLDLFPGIVPPGETVKCWLPWPRENHARQQFVKLLGACPGHHQISRPGACHRTVYFENPADSMGVASFNINLETIAYAQYFDPVLMQVLPYDTSSALYAGYTSEHPPHIVFTPEMRSLSEGIAGKEQHPVEIVRKLFYWIDANIPWTGALEYSLMPFIPGYVSQYMRGDCGMKTLLFMTLARIRGIPARWQSGWMLHPGEINLHDWCEVYYEGVGWVPVDVSFGLLPSENVREREFYLSGIDAYRLIVNDGIGTPLEPVKQYFRSEPWDFQRGETEWKDGNLYFDKWRYKMVADILDHSSRTENVISSP